VPSAGVHEEPQSSGLLVGSLVPPSLFIFRFILSRYGRVPAPPIAQTGRSVGSMAPAPRRRADGPRGPRNLLADLKSRGSGGRGRAASKIAPATESPVAFCQCSCAQSQYYTLLNFALPTAYLSFSTQRLKASPAILCQGMDHGPPRPQNQTVTVFTLVDPAKNSPGSVPAMGEEQGPMDIVPRVRLRGARGSAWPIIRNTGVTPIG
jgi:hypothetical protein